MWQCVGEAFFYYVTLMEYHHLANGDVRNLLKNIILMNLNSSEHKNCILN